MVAKGAQVVDTVADGVDCGQNAGRMENMELVITDALAWGLRKLHAPPL